jgi:phosphoribosylformylglycinamidine cyclo-ligase
MTEMWDVFNCGIGFTIVVSPENSAQSIQHLKEQGIESYHIGTIHNRINSEAQVLMQ